MLSRNSFDKLSGINKSVWTRFWHQGRVEEEVLIRYYPCPLVQVYLSRKR